MTDQERVNGERDVVAELVRAAGHRAVPPADLEQRVRAAAHASWQRTLVARRQRRWSYALAASLLVAVVGASALLPRAEAPAESAAAVLLRGDVERWTNAGWQPLSGEAVSAGDQLRARGEGGAAFELVGAATLRVAAGTEWRMTAARNLDLSTGAVYLDSAGLTGGFAVATALGTVRDIGTQFEVRTDGRVLRVSVREGAVELGDSAAGAVTARAGERVVVRDNAVEREPISPLDSAWAWAEALAEPMRIDGRSTYEVLTWVAREMGRKLVFSEQLAELRARNAILSGSDGGLMPQEALEVAIAATDGLDYRLEDDSLIVRLR